MPGYVCKHMDIHKTGSTLRIAFPWFPSEKDWPTAINDMQKVGGLRVWFLRYVKRKKTNIQTRWPQYFAPLGANVYKNVSYYACNVCCNKSVFSFYMSTWHCWAQSAAVRRAAAPLLLGATVDRYLPPARCSAANPPQRYAAGEWCDRRTDRQTDLWTPDRFIDPAPHTTPALRPISKNQ